MSRSDSKPDFIGIGPTKTGTSWLYTVLRLHPDIWLPPVSEVNFHWGNGRRIQKGSIWKNFKQRIKGDIRIQWRKEYFMERLSYYRNSGNRSWKEISWDLRYVFLPQTPSWYLSLYRGRNKVCGDISGGYYVMDDIAIARLANHIPDAKIIMCFRDPVSRLWSQARMMLLYLTGRNFEDIKEKEFYTRFERAHARMPSYVALYRRWTKYFTEKQILVCYYDDLVKDPAAFVRRICNFLEVSTELTPRMRDALYQRVFEGPKVQLPEAFRKYLISLTTPCVRELTEVTGHEYPRQWLANYQNTEYASKA